MYQPPASAPSASQELSEGRLAVSIGISIFLLLAGGVGLIASTVLYFMKRRRLQAQEAAFQPPRYTEPQPPRYTEPQPPRYMEPPQQPPL